MKISNKGEKNIESAFKIILNIVKKKLPEYEQQIEANRYISFFSDKGTEFISKNLKTFLKKMGAAIFPRLDRRTGKTMTDFINLLNKLF